MFHILKSEGNRAYAKERLYNLFNNHPEECAVTEGYYGPKDAQIAHFNSASFRFSLSYDPVHTIKKIEVPILAVYGDRDLIVSCDESLSLLQKTLDDASHKNHMLVCLPKHNHSFQRCETGSMEEYFTIKETTSPEALEVMSDWIYLQVAAIDRAWATANEKVVLTTK